MGLLTEFFVIRDGVPIKRVAYSGSLHIPERESTMADIATVTMEPAEFGKPLSAGYTAAVAGLQLVIDKIKSVALNIGSWLTNNSAFRWCKGVVSGALSFTGRQISKLSRTGMVSTAVTVLTSKTGQKTIAKTVSFVAHVVDTTVRVTFESVLGRVPIIGAPIRKASKAVRHGIWNLVMDFSIAARRNKVVRAFAHDGVVSRNVHRIAAPISVMSIISRIIPGYWKIPAWAAFIAYYAWRIVTTPASLEQVRKVSTRFGTPVEPVRSGEEIKPNFTKAAKPVTEVVVESVVVTEAATTKSENDAAVIAEAESVVAKHEGNSTPEEKAGSEDIESAQDEWQQKQQKLTPTSKNELATFDREVADSKKNKIEELNRDLSELDREAAEARKVFIDKAVAEAAIQNAHEQETMLKASVQDLSNGNGNGNGKKAWKPAPPLSKADKELMAKHHDRRNKAQEIAKQTFKWSKETHWHKVADEKLVGELRILVKQAFRAYLTPRNNRQSDEATGIFCRSIVKRIRLGDDAEDAFRRDADEDELLAAITDEVIEAMDRKWPLANMSAPIDGFAPA